MKMFHGASVQEQYASNNTFYSQNFERQFTVSGWGKTEIQVLSLQSTFCQTLLPVPLHHVQPLKLPPTELAGIRGWDATLVAEMPGDGVLVQVSPPTPVAAEVETLRLAASPGFLLSDIAAAQV